MVANARPPTHHFWKFMMKNMISTKLANSGLTFNVNSITSQMFVGS